MSVSQELTRRQAIQALGVIGISTLLETTHLPSFIARSQELTVSPTMIDGLETYGDDAPLSQNQVNEIITSFNEMVSQGQTKMDNDTCYTTLVTHPANYINMPTYVGESYQKFLTRQVNKFNEMLTNASSLLEKFVARRLIVMEDSAFISASWHLGWITGGINDSDGAEGLWFGEEYNPTTSSYYDSLLNIDRGAMHEAGHSTFHLPDTYAIETDFRTSELSSIINLPQERLSLVLAEKDRLSKSIPLLRDVKTLNALSQISNNEPVLNTSSLLPVFNGVSEEWQIYLLGNRNDNRNGLMNSCNLNFCEYTTEIMNRRVRGGWTHDFEKTIPESSWTFPNEFARQNILVFGEEYNDCPVKVYRSGGEELNKTMEEVVSEGVVSNGQINIGNPFLGAETDLYGVSVIPSYKSLLFIKVESPEGVRFRYLDTGDLSIPFWKTNNRAPVVTLQMNLADNNISPSNFDWRITDLTKFDVDSLPVVIGS